MKNSVRCFVPPLQTPLPSIQTAIYMPFHNIDNGVKQQTLQLISEGWSLEQAIGVSCRSID